MYYRFSQFIVWLVSFIFFPMKVSGLENIPKKEGCIFASNHLSYLDPMVIPTIVWRKMAFVAKRELFQNKILGFLIGNLGAFPINRASSDVRAIKQIINKIDDGFGVLIFPEGTRSVVNPEDRKIQPGIGLIAVRTKAPVIPIYIEGTDKVLPPKAKMLKRHWVEVTFGKPIYFSDQKDYQKVSEEIMKSVYSLKKHDF